MPLAQTKKRQPISKEEKKYQRPSIPIAHSKETRTASSTAYIEDLSVPGGKRFIEPCRERREPNNKPSASARYPNRCTQAQKVAADTQPNTEPRGSTSTPRASDTSHVSRVPDASPERDALNGLQAHTGTPGLPDSVHFTDSPTFNDSPLPSPAPGKPEMPVPGGNAPSMGPHAQDEVEDMENNEQRTDATAHAKILNLLPALGQRNLAFSMSLFEDSMAENEGVDIHISTPAKRSRSSLQSGDGLFRPSRRRSSTVNHDIDQPRWFVDVAFWTFRYIVDVLRAAILLLRFPLALALAFWLLALLSASWMNAVHTFVSPICEVPVVGTMCAFFVSGRSGPQAKSSPLPSPPKIADYPHLIDLQSRTLDKLLAEASAGSMLSADIRKAEMATTDLITLVKVSDLENREIIVETLQQIAQNSKKAGKALSALDSRVNRAVDSIYAVNDYALRRMADARQSSSISMLNWLALRPRGARDEQQVTNLTFEMVMSVLASEMGEVLIQCDASQSLLDNLEHNLIVLHEILSREFSSITKERSELLAALWTLLGGNKRQLVDMKGRMKVLKDLGNYRTEAKNHIGTSVQTVQALTEDMEDLRARVAAPAIVEDRVPVEVQLRSIQAGLERLSIGRRRVQKPHVMVSNAPHGQAAQIGVE
ncbi:hypothetical protein NM688_g3253 [Phlebia brevispora]|uniref:Uncharacterized protein n=1 Tax=Phlebia brevispora TaxID=194682 RepID=A0ACC1T679_9APHY|nr:hypothetical protein NM688_g3253 [Phlebia brevispora]